MSKARTSKKSTPAPKQEAPKPSSKRPTHVLYAITEGSDGKGFWTQIAAGWLVNGGIAIRSRTGAILLPGTTYQVRERSEKEDGAKKPQQASTTGGASFEDDDIPF